MPPKDKAPKNVTTREAFRSDIDKTATRVENWWTDRDNKLADLIDLKVELQSLKACKEKLKQLDQKIQEALDENEIAAEVDKCTQLQRLIYKIEYQLDEMVEMHTKTDAEDSQNDEAATVVLNKQRVKLPKLSLPTFTGDPLHWQEFWDCFESTIHKSTMSDIDKLNYLKGSLQGDAERAVSGFRTTATNYQEIVDTLKERFGNPEFAIFAHFEQLLSLPMATMDTASLQQTHDKCEGHVRSLVALGLQESMFGLVFTPIILSKMPRGIRVELHRKNGSNTWTLPNLRDLLREEIKARQLGDWVIKDQDKDRDKQKDEQNRQRKFQANGRNGDTKTKPPTTSTLFQNSKPATATQQPNTIQCVYCKGGHFSDQCKKFVELDARKEIIRSGKHCFKCLSTKHLAYKCPKNTKCYHCSDSRHHSSLCAKKYGKKGSTFVASAYHSQLQSNNDQNTSSSVSSSNGPAYQPTNMPQIGGTQSNLQPHNMFVTSNAPRGQVYTQTATVKLQTTQGSCAMARIYFDTGSSCSYITSALVNHLKLKPVGEFSVSNAVFEQTVRQPKTYPVVNFAIPAKQGKSIPISAYVTAEISCPLQKLPIDLQRFPVLKKLDLADTVATKVEFLPIDILIGVDHYYDIVLEEQIRLDGGLILLGSKLGYIPTGKVPSDTIASTETCAYVSTFLNIGDAACLMQGANVDRLWRLEDIGINDDPYRKDDDYAVKQFNETIKFVDGRYEVGLPWKDRQPELPSNKELAFSRLAFLWKRISCQPQVVTEYNKILEEQAQKGIIEEVAQTELEKPSAGGLVHYLPHHCVIRQDHATTKVRVVHDASSKANKSMLSLNECLLRGPVFLSDLSGLLLRFRMHQIAVISDIEKAFLMVSLRPKDRDVTRFMWLKDISKPVRPENVKVFRFTRVFFGAICSPFLLAATIKHHLEAKGTSIAKRIATNIYVDNSITGCETVEESLRFYKEAKSLFGEISMNIREWFSNCQELISQIPEVDRGKAEITKVLGMTWNTQDDTLSCANPKIETTTTLTKRQLVEHASRIFDPCGFMCPSTIRLKLLVQETWKLKLHWDERVPHKLVKKWQNVVDDIQSIHKLKLPRFVGSSYNTVVWTTHCFCDASKKAYAACVYLQNNRTKKCTLVFAKSRLAPIRQISIPRLELISVEVGTRIARFVTAQLNANVSKSVIWTDSTCTLQWIKTPKVLSTFVANRIRKIKNQECTFRYVPSELNPADLPTKGITTDELATSTLWWQGPAFLLLSEEKWPESNVHTNDVSIETECPEQAILAVESMNTAKGPGDMDPMRYSTLDRLIRVTCWMFRFVNALKTKRNAKQAGTASIASNKPHHTIPSIEADEYKNATLAWIAHVQSKFRRTDLRFKNLVKQLELFLDENGVWRCGGRLANAQMSYEAKFPVLLDQNHPFTKLVILDCHTRLMHTGVTNTLNELRSCFWVPHGRTMVKKVIGACKICQVWKTGPYKKPDFPPLPDFRVTRSKPFQYTGVDYLGPLITTENADSKKVWICLFTCAVTRAIHLEVVPDLTTNQFLLCLRRFVAIHAKPQMMISDNGKYFKAAHNVMAKLWGEMLVDSSVADYSARSGIQWKFIPEYAPWMGGFYERLVQTVKQALKTTLGRKHVTLIQLQTMVAEVSNIVNKRPLTVVDDQEKGVEVLTPAKLLGKSQSCELPYTPSAVGTEYQTSMSRVDEIVNHWKLNTAALNRFWDLWHSQYLRALRESHTHSRVHNPKGTCSFEPTLGSIVLIKDEYRPRSVWKMGVICYLNHSEDGKIRSASIRLGSGKTLVRPICHLYPIEIPGNSVDNFCQTDQSLMEISDGNIYHSGKRNSHLSQRSANSQEGNSNVDDTSQSANSSSSSSNRRQRKAAIIATHKMQQQVQSSEEEDEYEF